MQKSYQFSPVTKTSMRRQEVLFCDLAEVVGLCWYDDKLVSGGISRYAIFSEIITHVSLAVLTPPRCALADARARSMMPPSLSHPSKTRVVIQRRSSPLSLVPCPSRHSAAQRDGDVATTTTTTTRAGTRCPLMGNLRQPRLWSRVRGARAFAVLFHGKFWGPFQLAGEVFGDLCCWLC